MQKNTKKLFPKHFVPKTSISLVLGALLVLTTPVSAQTPFVDNIWTGGAGADTSIFNPNNWSLGPINPSDPYQGSLDPTQNGVINTGTNAAATWTPDAMSYGTGGDIAYLNAGHITLGDGVDNYGRLVINMQNLQMGSSNFTAGISVGRNGGGGILEFNWRDYQQGSNTYFTSSFYGVGPDGNPFELVIGDGVGSQGALNINGSGYQKEYQGMSSPGFGSSQTVVGKAGGTGVVNINGGGLSNGSASPNPTLRVGEGQGSKGFINVFAGGKLSLNLDQMGAMPDTEPARVGLDGGSGRIKIDNSYRPNANGAQSRAFFGTGVVLGDGANSVGEINILAGGSITSYTALDPVNPTTPVLAQAVQLGVNGGTGKVDISEAGSIWRVGGSASYAYNWGNPTDERTEGLMRVGVSGTGELTLSEGGQVSIGKTAVEGVMGMDPDTGYLFNYTDVTHFVGGTGTLNLAEQAGSVGTLNIGAAAGQAAVGSGTLDAANIVFGQGLGTIVLNHTDTNHQFVAALSGNGTVNQYAGTTWLNGNSSAFTGTTNIFGGKLGLSNDYSLGGVSSVTYVKTNGALLFANGVTNASAIVVDGGVDLGLGIDGSDAAGESGIISGAGNLIKTGSGSFTLSNANTYTGTTQVDAGTLVLAGAGSIAGSSSVTLASGATLNMNGATAAVVNNLSGAQGSSLNIQNSTLTVNNTTNTRFSGDFAGTTSGSLIKTGSGIFELDGDIAGTTLAAVTVQQGSLVYTQTGTIHVTGDHITESGATTDIGRDTSYLNVGGSFIQQSGSTLNITLGAGSDITANQAVLDGSVRVLGFNSSASAAASSISNGRYTMISTTNGITGDFINNDGSTLTAVDYLLYRGFNMGNTYEIGFATAWAHGNQSSATGSFTVAAGTAFDQDIALTDRTGITFTNWDGKSLTKKGDGDLTLSAHNTYTGTTDIQGGNLLLAGLGDISSSSAVSFSVANGGGNLDISGLTTETTINQLSGERGNKITLGGKTLRLNQGTDSQYAGDFANDAGSLVKEGAGVLTLSGQTLYTGQTVINAGGLVLDGINGAAQLNSNVIGANGTSLSLVNGAVLTGTIDPTDVTIDASSLWNMTGDSIVGSLNHAGRIEIVDSIPHNILTVAGDFVGNGGTIAINTALRGDNSSTDKVVIEGNSSGTAKLKVINAKGAGAQTTKGIQVIEVKGQSDAQFTLEGRALAGAYEYLLYQGTPSAADGNWYLRSALCTVDCGDSGGGAPTIYRPELGAYLANQTAATNMFIHTLHDRLGEPQFTESAKDKGYAVTGWGRVQGGSSHVNGSGGQLNSSDKTWLAQVGSDFADWSNNGTDRVQIGAMASYGNNQSKTSSSVEKVAAKVTGEVKGYSVGAYGTWFHNTKDMTGPYVDTWLQYSWFDNTVRAGSVADQNYKSSAVTGSVEAGWAFKLAESQSSMLLIEPQAQLIYSYYNQDEHRDEKGLSTEVKNKGTLMSRIGARLFGKNVVDAKTVVQPFFQANWLYKNKATAASFDGVTLEQNIPESRYELKVGLQAQMSKSLNLWVDVGYEGGANDYNNVQGNLGLKYVW